VRNNYDFLRQRARLGHALEQWKTRGRHEDYLLAQGLPLAEAESLLRQHENVLGAEEADFIRSSQLRAQREELRRTKARRAVMAGLSALSVLACGGGAIAVVQWKTAKEAKETQKAMLKQASEQDYNVAHRLMKEGDLNLALNYLARSIQYNPRNESARIALAAALYSNQNFPFKLAAAPLRHGDTILSVEFSRDGRFVITASADGTARVWETATGKAVGEPLRHKGEVRSAKFSRDGRFVVTAGWDRTARVWEAATGKAVGEPLRHEIWIQSAEFGPDARFVVTSTLNGLRMWDTTTGRAIGEPLRHGAEISSAKFSPHGQFVATVSNNEVRVWEVMTGKAVSEPLRHNGDIGSAEFGPDGRFLVLPVRTRCGCGT
jgi:hypothetical protein